MKTKLEPAFAGDLVREAREAEARRRAREDAFLKEALQGFADEERRSKAHRPLADEVFAAAGEFLHWARDAGLMSVAVIEYAKAPVLPLRGFPGEDGRETWLTLSWYGGFHLERRDGRAGPAVDAVSGAGLAALPRSVLEAMLAYFRSTAPWEDVRAWIASRRR